MIQPRGYVFLALCGTTAAAVVASLCGAFVIPVGTPAQASDSVEHTSVAPGARSTSAIPASARSGAASAVSSATPTAATSAATTARPVSVSSPTGAASSAAPRADAGSSTASSPATPTPSPLPPQEPEDQIDCSKVACIALTFDDGPGPYTQTVVDAFANAGAKATFFVIGRNVQASPGPLAYAASHGMEIGDHTQDHATLSGLSTKEGDAQIETCAVAVQKVTGRRPTLLRPPGGNFVAGSSGYDGLPVVMWSVDTKDWSTHSRADTYTRAVAGARPGGIILMHDVVGSTSEAVPDIIAQLRAYGFRLVTVSKLLGHPEPGHVYKER